MRKGVIKVAARSSPLSLAQMREIEEALPDIVFEKIAIKTTGDLDHTQSLRKMDKSNFFTKELDDMLLNGECQITIHSAKDLPEPLPKGLKMIALTKGVDTSDVLVLPDGNTLEDLPEGSLIGTSTLHREEAVRSLRSDLKFLEIRGSIGERLELLKKGDIEALVIAEAALIRLGLTHLNRITLPGVTAPLQGKLAILAREGDEEMETLFSRIDIRRTTLYLGLVPPSESHILHFPVIQCSPLPFAPLSIPAYTHIIFTSKTAVEMFVKHYCPTNCIAIAVGKVTAEHIVANGLGTPLIATEERAEGVVKLLETLDLASANVLWPHSQLSRTLISDYLTARGVQHTSISIYTTHAQVPYPLPDLKLIDEIIFTSPSTVDAFSELCPTLPEHVNCTAIGPVTSEKMEAYLSRKRVKKSKS